MTQSKFFVQKLFGSVMFRSTTTFYTKMAYHMAKYKMVFKLPDTNLVC